MNWVWIISTSILTLLLCVSMYYNYRFALILLNLEDGIENALDTLDEKYNSMSKILEKPVFFDSLEIRQVIRDIKDSRDVVLYVANILGSIDESSVETEK